MDNLHVSSLVAPQNDNKKRSLRTYGKKRTLQTSDAPATTDKRRRITAAEPELPPPSTVSRQSSISKTSNFAKGSILNYFKPCLSSCDAGLTDRSSDPPHMSSTPPSSPPPTETKRTPRRLRLRPPTPVIVPLGTVDLEDPKASEENRQSSVQYKGKASQMPGKKTGAVRSTLQQSPDTTLNTKLPYSEAEEGQKTNPTRSRSAPIQTTINLSTKPAFEECKMCHIVYNPLHPKDVRYHTQRHKAIMRSQGKE